MEINIIFFSFWKACWVPSPWWTSQSTIATLLALWSDLNWYFTLKKISGSDGNIVIDTKPIYRMPASWVVSWRPHASESILPLACHNLINPIKDTSDGELGTFLCFFIKVSIKNSNVSPVWCFRPERANMFDIFLGVYEPDILISDYSIDGTDELHPRMRSIEFFLQHLHNKLHPLGSLGVLSLALVLGHARVINQTSFSYHYILMLNYAIKKYLWWT